MKYTSSASPITFAKQSVEKDYFDSSSQHSSSSSDNYSSGGGMNATKDQNQEGTSEILGVVTDQSIVGVLTFKLPSPGDAREVHAFSSNSSQECSRCLAAR
jgi:hypothetical protein